MRTRLLSLLLLACLAGCDLPWQRPEDLYTYQLNGPCDKGPPLKCEAALISTLSLQVVLDKQQVVLSESAAGNYSAERDQINIAPVALDCKIVSSDEFACPGLIRRAGKFIDSEVVSGRQIHSAFLPRAVAAVTGSMPHLFVDWMDNKIVNGILWGLSLFAGLIAWAAMEQRR